MRRQQPRNAGINFIDNHPLLGKLQRGGQLSINDVCHLWIFHYNDRNWWLTTLWDLLVALKFYMFLKKIIKSWDSTKAKKLTWFCGSQINWGCETVLLSGIWYWEHSGKAKNLLFCWLMVYGCWVFNYHKNSNSKKTKKESTKIQNIFCKVSSSFFSEDY